MPLVNSDGNPVETVAQAVAELNRLRTQCSDDTLPKFGRTPTFADYADAYLAGSRPGRDKETGHHRQRENTLMLWKTILAESGSTR